MEEMREQRYKQKVSAVGSGECDKHDFIVPRGGRKMMQGHVGDRVG